MDDDRKKFPRKGGSKSFGGKRDAGGPRPDKSEGPKTFRPAGKKPFANRSSNDRIQPEGAAKPFGAGPRGDKKPFEKRPRPAGEGRPFPERGERREWKPRPEGQERPKREFRPRPAGDAGDEGRRPFVKRAEGERPFVRREGGEAGGQRPRRDFERKERFGERDERREFRRADRPRDGERRFERRERPAEGGERTGNKPGMRSFGSKSHEGQRRSYGMKSHEGGDRKPFRKRADAVEEAPGERIAKRLARAGIASRRDAEELIAAGRVSVNGRKLDSPALNVMPDDRIEVDGTAIPAIERTRLFLFHKPAGVVTTNRDPEGRKTVFDILPTELPRLMTIGRLDINTEGLLLLTNDGGLARVLELPATGWLRRYRARVHGKVEEKTLAGLKDGIAVDGVFYGSVEATLDREQGSNAWLTVGLREGKNREVKNILGALGLEVSRLIRVSYGPFQLGELPEGHVLEIKGRMLRDQLGERLIEESGANFEAGVATHFPNQPVKRASEPRGEVAERPRIQRDGERGRIGEGGLIKKRHRRENTRDEALGKLSTRPERGDRKPFGDRDSSYKFGDKGFRDKKLGDKAGKPGRGQKGEREQRPIEPPGQRKSNVWMAPGARPQGRNSDARERAPRDGDRRGPGTSPRGKGRG